MILGIAMNTPDSPEDSAAELDLLFHACARHALREPQGAAFPAWFSEVAPMLAPDFFAKIKGDESNRRSAAHTLGRLLWNRIPLPDNHFRPRPLPKPERNAPCPCGSGRKYKQCCAGAEDHGNPFENFSLLRYVLDQYSRAQLKELPLAYLDREELAFIANEWINEDRAADAAALLEPLFADVGKLDERAEWAFDTLVECYNALGKPKKKQQLIAGCLKAPDPTLRSAALHRRITILADQGDYAQAWQLFQDALRLQPDNPNLATLEITLLLGQGDHERIKERGQFWLARLARDRNHDYSDLMAHLRELIADPDALAMKYESRDRPGLVELRQLIATMPPAACQYGLHRDGDEAWLEPSPELQDLLAEWRARVTVFKPHLTALESDDAEAWERLAPGLAWLKKHPRAWQCFDILDDLALAVDSADIMGAEHLLLPIQERACALLRLVLATNQAEQCRLPWAFLENRPALRLVVALIYRLRDRRRLDDAQALAEWMLFTLNPNDNHGLREDLAHLYLERGNANAALAVCDRYPDDVMAATLFDRALALHILGRAEEATAALRLAAGCCPHVLPTLVAANPKRPRLDPAWVTVGGKDEAWLYREAMLPVWRASDALDWARAVAPKRRG
jgi:tetratricopeptide (TPR) repeat protein